MTQVNIKQLNFKRLSTINKAFSSLGSHSIVITEDGSVFSWGNGCYGQLGHGIDSHLSVPTKISTLSNVVSIACGSYHSMAITGNFIPLFYSSISSISPISQFCFFQT